MKKREIKIKNRYAILKTRSQLFSWIEIKSYPCLRTLPEVALLVVPVIGMLTVGLTEIVAVSNLVVKGFVVVISVVS